MIWGIVIGIIVGAVVGVMMSTNWNRKKISGIAEGQYNNEAEKEKEAKLAKLREFIANMETPLDSSASNGVKLTNDLVQKELGVSDATAERYLNDLEAEGLIRQVGSTGHSVYYEKV